MRLLVANDFLLEIQIVKGASCTASGECSRISTSSSPLMLSGITMVCIIICSIKNFLVSKKQLSRSLNVCPSVCATMNSSIECQAFLNLSYYYML